MIVLNKFYEIAHACLLTHEERESVDVVECYSRSLCHAMQRIFRYMEVNLYLIGKAFVKSSEQSATSREVDSVLNNICIEFWRSVFEC